MTCDPPHAKFWYQHKERAQFLFVEQIRADQLKYIGEELVPNASPAVQKLLDCLFIRNQLCRPKSEDVLKLFVDDMLAPGQVRVDVDKLDKLKSRIGEEEIKVRKALNL